MTVKDIIFYINIPLMFCAIVEMTALILMTKKTALYLCTCYTCVILFAIGVAAYVVQLLMYINKNAYDIYAVYIALGILGAAFISVGAYCIPLGRRSNALLCVIAGIFASLPPIGTVFCVMLLFRMRFDTQVESVIYHGYAYTFAALASFVGKFKVEFIDGSGEENYDELSAKDAAKLIKKLRKAVRTPEGCYKYGAALAYYQPKYMSDAVKYIKKAAKKDYPPALYNLGYFYEIGYGVKRDEKRAVELYRRAAEAGDNEAALRLGIAEILNGKHEAGVAVFRDRAESGDIFAKYNLALCCERGIGGEADLSKAVDMYMECIKLITAQKRLFALAAECVLAEDVRGGHRDNGQYDKITSHTYEGAFARMIEGLKEIRDKHASDAADRFLEAVMCRGKWEGMARCLVGTLYVDSGKLPIDRRHGAEYVKSAFPLTPVAKDVYFTIPKSVIKYNPQKDKSAKSPPDNKPAEQEQKEASATTAEAQNAAEQGSNAAAPEADNCA